MNNSTLIKRFINGLVITGLMFGVFFFFSGMAQANANSNPNNISQPTQTLPPSEPGIYLLKPTDPSITRYDGEASGSTPTSPEAVSTPRSDPLNSSATSFPGAGVLPSAAEISVSPTEINSKQLKELVTLPLSIVNLGADALNWQLLEGQVYWSDNFDSYLTGSQLHGQGGWLGWGNDLTYGALTSDEQARSTPNSVNILGTSDLTHSYSGITSGVWIYTAWQYIPSDFAGTTYFILLNTYTDGGTDTNWSAQVIFNSFTGEAFNDGPAGGALPMIKGQWVEIRDVIDLDADTQTFYYGGEILFTDSWTEGMTGGGALNVAGVDLFAYGASSVFYDDLSLSQIMDLSWLSTDPISGTTVPGDTSNVDVMLDATGLDLGLFTATLFVSSNDPLHPMIEIPVTLTVDTPFYLPFINK